MFHLDEYGERVLEKGLAVRLVETGASTDTNDHGEFRLKLPAFFGPGEKVTVTVAKEGWLVRNPIDGKVRVPADPRKNLVDVELLPKGSKKYLDDDERIERLIAETAKEAVCQQAAEQAGGAPREGIDFSRAIREWATRYGLDPERAKAEVDRWVLEVGLRSDDERRRGLAQLYEKNFVKAAEHFDLAAQGRKERSAQIARERDKLGVEEAQPREALVEDLWLEATAHFEAHRFEASIATWREALGYVSRETSPSQWAGLQNNLGIALGDQGVRTGGDTGARLLAKAVNAYRLALQVRTRSDLPQQWAMTQNNLGDALTALGRFDEAAAAFRDVLEEMPDYQGGVLKLSALYHENLHDHEAAHALLADWLGRHPDDLVALIYFPELLFASQRYRDCQQASRDLADRLTRADELHETAVLRVFTAASLLAEGDVSAAVEPLRTALELIREQPEDFTTGWIFDGTLRFVRHTPELRNRETLAALFQALEAPDRDAIIEGLGAVVERLEGGPQ